MATKKRQEYQILKDVSQKNRRYGMTIKSKKCSECSVIDTLLKRELKEFSPMLRRLKFVQRRDSKKTLWNGFSEDSFCN